MEREVILPLELWPRRGGWVGKVVSALKREGESVRKGEPLLEVEIEKAILVVESPYSGVVKEIAQPGRPVKPGSPVARVEVYGEAQA
ncbi:MAG: lipoyl domain-containing protein [Acidilobaceae archaeon]|nr:lipoyl domain-containing protein [Acidilobaceae archaeon]